MHKFFARVYQKSNKIVKALMPRKAEHSWICSANSNQEKLFRLRSVVVSFNHLMDILFLKLFDISNNRSEIRLDRVLSLDLVANLACARVIWSSQEEKNQKSSNDLLTTD